MGDTIILEWTFTPPDFFEEKVDIQQDGIELQIEHGKVLAIINKEVFDGDPNFRLNLHEKLKSRFLAVQVISHEAFELSKPNMVTLHPAGRKHTTIFPEANFSMMFSSKVDFIVKDKDGNITSDSKKERIDRNEKIANLVEKYHSKDSLLESLLKSYDLAVNNPENELILLYEIRDAVSKLFGNEVNARSTLNISKDNWSRLGVLANHEPLLQGRHRGKNYANLRKATDEELNEARSIAQEIIEKYILWLDSKATP